MKYKSPKQHNNVVQTMLEEAIKKIIKTKQYEHYQADVNVLTNVLDYHQQINDKEIKRVFYEDFRQMQQELPVINVDSDLLSIITKHVTQYGFALTHGPHGEHMSTALLHKAGYKVSTELKNGLNAKRTNVINMLSLVIKDENLMEIEDTKVESYTHRKQFLDGVKLAVEDGGGVHSRFGTKMDTLEEAYKLMLIRQQRGSVGWDDCIKAYQEAFEETPDLATQFINAIGYATKYGETKDYKFGTLQYTLEQAYENTLEMQENGSVKYDDCIKAYQEAFCVTKETEASTLVTKFTNAIELAVASERGIHYKYGLGTDTLEDVYKEVLEKQEGGADKWDKAIKKYQDTFTESAFIYAVGDDNAPSYKFGKNQRTLENLYQGMLTLQENESVKYTDCIEAYEYEFYEDVFKNAIEKALKDGSGIKHRFGMDKDTLEDVYKDMVMGQDTGLDECDACIKAYQKAFLTK